MSVSRIEAAYPLSPLQEGLLFHSLHAAEPGMYLTQVVGLLEGEIDLEGFQVAWQRVAQRHSILRTAFALKNAAKPLQVVGREVRVPFAVEDWSDLPEDEREPRWRRYLEEDRRRGFDPAKAPMMRLALARETGQRHRFLWSHHHALLDGWSLSTVLAEVLAIYGAHRTGVAPALPPSPPFRDYIAWLQRQDLAQAESFWRRELAGFATSTPLRVGRDRPDRDAIAASHNQEQSGGLRDAAAEALRARARACQVTVNTLVQAAWAALLGRYSGEDDVLFGVTVSGRPPALPGVEDMVGLFINTLPLRVDVRPDRELLPWFRALQDRQLEILQYEHTPLVQVQGWSDVPRGLPLFETFLAFENYADRSAGGVWDGLAVRDVRAIEKTNYPLGVMSNTRLTLRVTYDEQRFDAVTVARLVGHLELLLESLAGDPHRRLGELPMLRAGELAQVLREWNDTATSAMCAPGPMVPERFAAQAAATPEAPAVQHGERVLSYRELDTLAGRVAAGLHALGLEPGALVGIRAERSPELVAALLGVWRAGGAYVPLDPAHPAERLAFMVENAGLSVLLDGESLSGILAHESVSGMGGPAGPAGPPHRPAADDPAYVIYTSGTTGRPKGVLVEHGNLANTLLAVHEAFRFDGADRVPCLAPFPFDIFLFELLGPLLAGGTVVLHDLRPTLDVERLVDELPTLTRLHAVPALMRQVVEAVRVRAAEAQRYGRLRTLFVGGDSVPAGLLRDLRELFPAARTQVLYGPTEGTIVCSTYPVPDDPHGAPIGRPFANVDLRLCDPHGRPVPVGVPGEIWIGGAGVSRGYLGRPELTAEKYPSVEGRRFYRTGDLARFRDDGTLEFLGRVDDQLKIRGFRVEPGEIEAALREHPGVREAVVVARQDSAGERILVGYVTGEPEPPAAAELRELLRARLPEYMVPGEIVGLDALPLTVNGKVDRRALPEPAALRRPAADRAPLGPVEEVVAGIWSEVLGHEVASSEASFFDLGGHSLLAMRVVSRLRVACAVEVPLRVLFDQPTVAGLARWIGRARAGGGTPAGEEVAAWAPPPLVPGPRAELLPLSFGQERFWFLDRLDPESSAYLLALAVRFEGPLDSMALRAALGELIRRHEILRTSFEEVEGEPRQRVHPPSPAGLPLFDLRGLPEAERWPALRSLALREGWRPFDLCRAPLLRAFALQLDEDDHAVVLALHHIVSDGWSMGILARELVALYGAFHHGAPSPLPELPVQYGDFALWQRSWLSEEVLAAQLTHWRQQLAGAPEVLELHGDRPRPPVQSFRGAKVSTLLSEELARALHRLGRQQGATLFMTLLAAFEALLGRYTAVDDLCVGTPVAGRQGLETEPLIGLFLNTLVLRNRPAPGLAFTGLLEQVREVAFAAYSHQDLPFEKLVDALKPQRSLSYNPLFQVMFALQNTPREEHGLPGLRVSPVDLEEAGAQFDLELTMSEGEGRLGGALKYATDLFDEATAARLLRHLEVLLAGAVALPSATVAELPLLDEAERRQLTVDWAGPAVALPDEGDICALVRAQALRAPGAVAVSCDGVSLTYAELIRRVEQLGRRLADAGAGSETLVGLFAERGIEFLVAMLAVFERGGAYVPFDPAHPAPRSARVLERSGCPLVLVDESSAMALDRALDALPAGRRPRVLPLIDPERADAAPVRPALVTPATLAYVIFTSGSTGKPKGAMVEHRGMLNHLVAKVRDLGLTATDVVAQTATQCFDISVWQFLAALLTGGRVEVLRDAIAHDPARLVDELGRGGVTVVETVPSLMRFLVDEVERRGAEAPRLERLRWLIPTGEALPPELCRRWLSFYPHVPLVNAYGPTECSDDVTHHLVTAPPAAGSTQVPIGRPIVNTRLYVLDRELRLLPTGAAGQLFVGGPGVGRGYLGDPAQTASVFVPDPFTAEPGGRLYATGDLARYQGDGALCFLGRFDHQVKLRGFRIELGEVEAVLGEHPGVREAAVLVDDALAALVAYAVLRDGAGVTGTGEIRAWLRERLPEYMVPAFIIPLAALPLGGTGKLDRNALPRPDAAQAELAGEPAGAAPRGATEELLAGLWSRLLGSEVVSAAADFFALGGHSLLVVQLVAAVRRAFGVELPLRVVFERSGLRAQAEAVEELLRSGEPGSALPPITPAPRSGPLPLSFAQQRLWFFDRFEPGSPAYNIPVGARLRGALDVAALAGSLSEVLRRHEILRTVYADRDGEPVQIALPADPAPLPVADLTALPAAARQPELHRLGFAESRRPFDLARGPVLRALLVRLAEDEHAALLTLHHIASDAWSAGVLIRELATLYGAFAERRPSPLPDLPVQYADYALWQRRSLAGDAHAAQLAYWRERLRDAPVLELPTDRPRPPVQSFRGKQRGFLLPGALAEALRALSRREDATLFMVVLAVFAVVLHHRSGQDDIVLGTNVAGRTHAETEGLIGFFLNMLALRIGLHGDPTFRELLARVRETALGAYAHQDLPFDRVLEGLKLRRDAGRHPLFQVKLDYENVPQGDGSLPGLEISPLVLGEPAAHSDLTVYVSERPDGLGVIWELSSDLFEEGTAEELAAQLERGLARVAERPEAPLSELLEHLAAGDRELRARRADEFKRSRRSELQGFRRRAVGAN